MSSELGPLDPGGLIQLDVLKAEPILRLLVAHRGWEDGGIPFADGWAAFQVFMRLPSRVDDHGGTFQVTPAEADPDVLEVFLGRQLSRDTGRGWADTRAVGLNWVFHPADEPDPELTRSIADGIEMWSTDFATLDEFFRTVEGTPAFRAASQRDIMASTFYSQDDVDDEDDP